MKKVLTIISLFIAAILIGGGIGFYQIYQYHHRPPTIKIEKASVFQAPMQYFNDYFSNQKTISILCTGNVAASDTQLAQCYNSSYESFHFEEEFHNVKSYITDADYACGNLATSFLSLAKEKAVEDNHTSVFDGTEGMVTTETPSTTEALVDEKGATVENTEATTQEESDSYDLNVTTEAPKESSDSANSGEAPVNLSALGLSGKGKFIAPPAFADALSNAGFNLFNTANPHTLDNGISGISSTIAALSSFGMWNLGTYEIASDKELMTVVSLNDCNIGFTGYTNHLNASLNSDYDFSIDYLEKYNEEAVKEMCERISKTKAESDFVISYLAMDEKKQTKIDSNTEAVIDQMILAGSDVIIGVQGHEVAPFEKRSVTNDAGETKEGYVFYSLGDFISPNPSVSLSNRTGLMVKLSLCQTASQVSLSSIDVLPTYTYETKEQTGVISILDALNSKDTYSDILDDKDNENIESIYADFMKDFTSLGNQEISEVNHWFHVEEADSNQVIEE